MLSEPDWDYLLDTVLLHHAMWTNGCWDFAEEVRQRVAAFGATPADRARLRFEIEAPEKYPVGTAPIDPGMARINTLRTPWADPSAASVERSTWPAAEAAAAQDEADAEPTERAVPVPADAYAALSLHELHERAEALGLPVSGPRRAVVARLAAHELRATGTADAAPFDLP